MRHIAIPAFCFLVGLCIGPGCKVPAVVDAINEAEKVACVFAAAETKGDAAAVISALCNIPIGDVVALLGQRQKQKARIAAVYQAPEK